MKDWMWYRCADCKWRAPAIGRSRCWPCYTRYRNQQKREKQLGQLVDNAWSYAVEVSVWAERLHDAIMYDPVQLRLKVASQFREWKCGDERNENDGRGGRSASDALGVERDGVRQF